MRDAQLNKTTQIALLMFSEVKSCRLVDIVRIDQFMPLARIFPFHHTSSQQYKTIPLLSLT